MDGWMGAMTLWGHTRMCVWVYVKYECVSKRLHGCVMGLSASMHGAWQTGELSITHSSSSIQTDSNDLSAHPSGKPKQNAVFCFFAAAAAVFSGRSLSLSLSLCVCVCVCVWTKAAGVPDQPAVPSSSLASTR